MVRLSGVVRGVGAHGGGDGCWLTLALARTEGGMTFSGPNACLGSMNEVRILPHFLHSAVLLRVSLGRGVFTATGLGLAARKGHE